MVSTQIKFAGITSNIYYRDKGQRDYAERTGTFHEIEMLNYIHNIKLSGTYLDIGGCSGNHAIFFKLHTLVSEVYTFEAHPENYKSILYNLEKNNIIGVNAFNHAIGHEVGTVSITENEYAGQNKVIEGNQIKMYPIDYYRFKDVSLMKIDVEGYEPNVLQGASETINKYKPLIFIESHTDPEWIYAYLPKGYELIRRFNNAPTYLFRFQL